MMDRVAISQTSNSEDLKTQLSNVLSHLDLSHREGAAAVIYPELSMTGYNSAVPEHLKLPSIERTLNDMLDVFDQRCRELNLVALVGCPIFVEDKPLPLNTMIMLGTNHRYMWTKEVPWQGEAEIFSGSEGSIYQNGLGVLICSDWDLRFRELATGSTVAWPGIMSRDWSEDSNHEFFDAIRELNLRVYYANWPSAPNPPPHMKEGGQSCMMTRDGIVVEAPKSVPGLLKCFDDLAFIPTEEYGT